MTLPTPAPRPSALDLRALADSAQALQGQLALADLPRWSADAPPWPAALEPLRWRAQTEWRASPSAAPVAGRSEARQLWLHLSWQAQVPLQCQRCLEPYLEPLQDERWFRFVADEACAEAEDEGCEEDLLVWVPRFNLANLIEDELLLSLPLVPMHELCPGTLPGAVRAAAANPDAATASDSAQASAPEQPQRPPPFAGLAQLLANHKR